MVEGPQVAGSYRNPATTEVPPTDAQRAAQKKLQEWLHKQMRVVLPDGRVMAGAAVCIDGFGNLVLEKVTETRTKTITNVLGETRAHTEEHTYPFVIVPGDKIASIELQKAAPDCTKLLSDLQGLDLSIEGRAVRGTQVPPLKDPPALD
eukprot:TRINITY_DN6514_c0_g3_i1.p2 TRINITY_DN6514_c0_g3~~TRINITY_DN6514_c0_g3_i1.p2  ORF type:complete len:149 (+),score=53.08 TRINITY_DN6514_c0_g3_i1:341-787(+)